MLNMPGFCPPMGRKALLLLCNSQIYSKPDKHSSFKFDMYMVSIVFCLYKHISI